MSIRSFLTHFITVLVAALLVMTAASVAVGGGDGSDDRRDRDERGDDDHDRDRRDRRDRDDEFEARLRGRNEVPPVDSDARGEAEFEVERRRGETRLEYKIEWRRGTDMLAVAGAHLHCAPEGENGPVVAFLAGVIAGGIDGDFEAVATLTDANVVNPACGETLDDLIDSMRDGNVYVNVHSAANPSGEIRGQVEED